MRLIKIHLKNHITAKEVYNKLTMLLFDLQHLCLTFIFLVNGSQNLTITITLKYLIIFFKDRQHQYLNIC